MIDTSISLKEINYFNEKCMVSHLGITYTEIGEDYLCGKMPVDERTKQPIGLLHGGANVTLAETLGSMAANLCLDSKKQFAVGLDINANHLKSVSSDYVYGKAKAIHIGKKTHVWEIKITNQQEELCCISRLTMAILDKKEGDK